jgi:NAD(P)-dependent dehydrogenase (short-subunit alcohol dehydrogenase family)
MSRVVSGSAVVTGGGSGIGRAIAEVLAAKGTAVALVDVLLDGGRETAEHIRARGGRALLLEADVSRWTDVDRAVTETVRALGPLGIMVNAAGVLDGYTPADQMSPALWERVVAIDLTGTFWGCKRALTELLPAGRGRIINVASVAGIVGSGGGPAYTAAKHGVVGLTKVAGLEYSRAGIRVNAVCPGVTDTPMVDRLVAGRPKMAQRLVAAEPIGRKGKPEEIAEAALWLCSDNASFVTGCAMAVDGGLTAQ